MGTLHEIASESAPERTRYSATASAGVEAPSTETPRPYSRSNSPNICAASEWKSPSAHATTVRPAPAGWLVSPMSVSSAAAVTPEARCSSAGVSSLQYQSWPTSC